MLRFLLVIAVVAALATSAFGSAAALGVNGGTIQFGQDTSLYCDADGVAVTGWGYEQSNDLVYNVKIGGIDTACIGNALFVTITQDDNLVPVFTTPGNGIALDSTNTGGSIATVAFPAPYLSAGRITGIQVAIEGPNPQ